MTLLRGLLYPTLRSFLLFPGSHFSVVTLTLLVERRFIVIGYYSDISRHSARQVSPFKSNSCKQNSPSFCILTTHMPFLISFLSYHAQKKYSDRTFLSFKQRTIWLLLYKRVQSLAPSQSGRILSLQTKPPAALQPPRHHPQHSRSPIAASTTRWSPHALA